MYDPLALLITYLKAQPEASDVPVAADLVGHTAGSKRVVPVLAGGFRAVRDKADRWEIDLNTYGPDKRIVLPLAMQARYLLLRRLPGQRLASVIVADVVDCRPHMTAPTR